MDSATTHSFVDYISFLQVNWSGSSPGEGGQKKFTIFNFFFFFLFTSFWKKVDFFHCWCIFARTKNLKLVQNSIYCRLLLIIMQFSSVLGDSWLAVRKVMLTKIRKTMETHSAAISSHPVSCHDLLLLSALDLHHELCKARTCLFI